jgi:hypothetical protein
MIYLLNKPYPYTIHILPRLSDLDFAPIKGVFDFYPNIFVLEVFFRGSRYMSYASYAAKLEHRLIFWARSP